jgi:hypothetical protein
LPTLYASDKLVSGYELTKRIPLSVELYLSDELRAGVGYKPILGDALARYVGVMLAHNAEAVTQEVFTAVVITGDSDVPGRAGSNAVLVPRVVTIELDPSAILGPETLTVLLEWKLQDEQGNIIWIDTVTGEGEAETWIPLIKEPRSNQIAAMFNDLFHKSFTALSSSRAIRDFAAKQAKSPQSSP